MNADSIFMIGTTHSVCQDYAYSKDNFVVISDGCSTSPHTDVGARLLVRAATKSLANDSNNDIAELHKQASRQALEWADEIGLPPQSVDATLLTASCCDGELSIGASGDGVIVLESHSGELDAYSISFPNGFPFYPAYQHQPERLLAWQNNQPALKEIRHFQAPGIHGEFELIGTSTNSDLTHTMRLRTNDYRRVVLFSDGIHSFYKTENDNTSKHLTPVPLSNVLGQLLAFKGSNGAFVVRRAKRFSQHCGRTGWYHADDLAIGAIHLADQEY